jgi:hypothetical protein
MNLRENIKNYVSNFQEENEYKQRMLDFLDNCENPFSRDKSGQKKGILLVQDFCLILIKQNSY